MASKKAVKMELDRSLFLWGVLSQLDYDTKNIDFEKIKNDLHIVSMGATKKRWSRLKIEMAMAALELQADESDEASEASMAPKEVKPSKSAKTAKPAKRAATTKNSKSLSTEDEDEDEEISDTEPASRPKSKFHTMPKRKPAVSAAKKPRKKTIVEEESEPSETDRETVVAKKSSKKKVAFVVMKNEDEVDDIQVNDKNEEDGEEASPLAHADPTSKSTEQEELSDDGN